MVGVLALQGAFAAHAAVLEPAGVRTVEVAPRRSARRSRRPRDPRW
ncbi:MAG: hypothetical protein R2695_09215 [Acidimicrobiales bacterium]